MDEQRNRVGERQYPMDDAPVTPSTASGGASPTWPGNANTAYEAERYEQARKRVRQLRGFYTSLTSFIAVNLLLFLINLFTSPGHWWFFWVALWWGIGLLWQAWSVFAPRFDRDWEERRIQKELRKNP